MTETIVIEVTWEAPLLQATLDAMRAGAPIEMASGLTMSEPPPPAPIPLSEWRSRK